MNTPFEKLNILASKTRSKTINSTYPLGLFKDIHIQHITLHN